VKKLDRTMQARSSAEIIPFPARPARVERQDPQARLNQALAALDAALARQRAAVSGWQGAIRALHRSVSGLDGNLARYQQSLAALEGQVGTLDDQARQIKDWADIRFNPDKPQG
jgi:hypothetical protein